jgi:hypothetical protein
MAKRYLTLHEGPSCCFDAAAKAEGAPGLDIDLFTSDRRRIIDEIKTTEPYLLNDFGAQQKQRFRDDFEKLNKTQADVKYLFVTEVRTHQILLKKYASEIPGVRIVLLGDPDEGPV